jgi:hypothetical protein
MMALAIDSPAVVTQYLLIQLGLGSAISQKQPWPIVANQEPPTPDDVITVRTTTGFDDGRIMVDGEDLHHYGIQIRVRSGDEQRGYEKANAIHEALAKSVTRATVNVNGNQYFIQCYSHIGQVLPLGKELQTTRFLHTVNAVFPYDKTN